MSDDKTIEVPAWAYNNIGLNVLRLQQKLQALWDACYLTHPDKEQLTRIYIKRLDELRGGESPITMDVSKYSSDIKEQTKSTTSESQRV